MVALVAAVALSRDPTSPAQATVPTPPAATPSTPPDTTGATGATGATSPLGPARVVVPDVVGQRADAASRVLTQRGLRAQPDVGLGADLGLVAAGVVTSTSPPPGADVLAGSDVVLGVRCDPACVRPPLPSSPTTASGACLYPGAQDAPVVEPVAVDPGGLVQVSGPAFPGAPAVRILVGARSDGPRSPDATEVARTAVAAVPDCTYSLSFPAPVTPGLYSVFIVFEPAVRIEPPFDLSVR